MILNKLVDYYDRLASEPEADIAPYGYSRQRISFAVLLRPDGTLLQFEDLRRDEGKRTVPLSLVVPGQAKPTGSGFNPCFLWDNAAYMLGFKPDDSAPQRTRRSFEAFRERHLSAEEEIGDEAFSAVCAFLRDWDPNRAADHPELVERAANFGVFRIANTMEYVHDRPAIKAYWAREIGETGPSVDAFSLINGKRQPIARLHEPKIKGVIGAQLSGATLVSFNIDAAESLGKSQAYNSPVGVEDAFKYCTALDRLTADDRRRVRLADATVVFWSERPTTFENDIGWVIEDIRADDEATVGRVRAFFDRLRRAAEGEKVEDADTPFYALGLSPNAARLSVRFWLEGTVQQYAKCLGEHLRDLEIGGGRAGDPPLTLKRILDHTARERKDVPPLLEGAVLRAILSGGAYPQMMFAAVLRRIRADRNIWPARAAILKAYLNRKARIARRKEIIGMALNQAIGAPAYHLGRLFAVLEKAQEEALGSGLNVTIKDRYFSSASANPVAAFPRILRLHAHHLNKIDHHGRKVNIERLVQEICSHVDAASGFPTHLPLDEQGLFFIGYYHQRQDLFTKKTDATTANLED